MPARLASQFNRVEIRPASRSTIPRGVAGIKSAAGMTDSRRPRSADEGRCEVALDELYKRVEVRLLLEIQRFANPFGLVEGVLVESLRGGDALATLEEFRALRWEGRDFVEVFHRSTPS
jgi:hypothetical protein